MSYSIAHTIPEEDHENYVTEEEAIQMIKGFNFHLKNLSIQTEELQKSNSNLSLRLSKEEERNLVLRKSVSEARTKLENLDKEKELKSQVLGQLELTIHSEFSKVDQGSLLKLEDFQGLMESGDNTWGTGLVSYLEHLESCSILLKTQKELLDKKISDKFLQMNSLVKCVNCRERYTPVKNLGKGCVYHTGKLRYFSCRGCGGDPYYDCCLKCKSCSKGCKVANHTS